MNDAIDTNRTMSLMIHWKSDDLGPCLLYSVDRVNAKRSNTKATKTLPDLLSKMGKTVETAVSAQSLNWGIHHVKLVKMAVAAIK